jgi:CRP-like cAMP-binding protein
MAYLSMQSQEAGSKSFTIPIGRVELADYISADRSAVTRELNAMRDEGIIEFDKNHFRIP